MAERPMACNFDNGPAIDLGARRRRSHAGERVIRSAAYAPVAFGRYGGESPANQNMRYRDAAARSGNGDSA